MSLQPTAAWRYAGIQVKWSAGFQISICLPDKSFSENPHNAKPQNVICHLLRHQTNKT
jgi:hypothetical protein